VTLTFDLLTPKAYNFEYIPRSFTIPSWQVLTLWNHSFLSYAVNKQTVSNILPTPTDIVIVGNQRIDQYCQR